MGWFAGVGCLIGNGRNADGDPLGGLPGLLRLRRADALDWVAWQTRGGDCDDDNLLRLRAAAPSLRAAGVKVFSWLSCFRQPDLDAAHVRAIKPDVDGVILNCEDDYEYGHAADAAFERTHELLAGIPMDVRLALSSYNWPSRWALDWRSWQARAKAFLPQAYTVQDPAWTPKALADDAAFVSQVVIGWWYRVRFTYTGTPAVHWVLAEDYDGAGRVTIKDGANRWALPINAAVGWGYVPTGARSVINRRTGKVVGQLLGFYPRDAVFPSLPTYASAFPRPTPTQLQIMVSAARVRGANLYLGELAFEADFAALASAILR